MRARVCVWGCVRVCVRVCVCVCVCGCMCLSWKDSGSLGLAHLLLAQRAVMGGWSPEHKPKEGGEEEFRARGRSGERVCVCACVCVCVCVCEIDRLSDLGIME